MKKRSIPFFLVVFTIFIFGQSSLTAQNIPQIHGLIFEGGIDGKPKKPIEGATIYLISKGQESSSNEEGEFLFNGDFFVGEGLNLIVVAEGYQTKEVSRNVGDERGIEKIVLEIGQGINGIYVQVKEQSEILKLLEGAEVNCEGKSYITDKHGLVFIPIRNINQIKGLLPLNLTVKKQCYHDSEAEIFYTPGTRFVKVLLDCICCDSTLDKPCIENIKSQIATFQDEIITLEEGESQPLLQGIFVLDLISLKEREVICNFINTLTGQYEELIFYNEYSKKQVTLTKAVSGCDKSQKFIFDILPIFGEKEFSLRLKINPSVTINNANKD